MQKTEIQKFLALLSVLTLLTPILGVITAFVDVNVRRGDYVSSDYALATLARERRYVIPLGNSVGVDVDMDGVKVVEVSEMVDKANQTRSPARDAGVLAGDNIVRINGVEVQNVEDVSRIINSENDSDLLDVEIRRRDERLNLTVEPVRDRDGGNLRIAAMVKDSTSGIGTLTFYDPDTGTFGALGHGITGNTGEPLNISGGSILSSTVVSVTRSERGQIGELRGMFLDQREILGEITTNNKQGLYGTLDMEMLGVCSNDMLPIATKSEVEVGRAHILSNIDSIRVEQFEIEIQRVMRRTSDNTKEMVIRVTDEELLERVGGIVQGMSGSPIIQNDKVVGAVTHVFVNDPTRGYGIFIESMLDNTLQNEM